MDAPQRLPDLTRVNVIGGTGSGKTTFCSRLSASLGTPHIEMDRLFHKPNWCEPKAEEFQRIVAEALQGNEWVLDGNYHSKTHEIKWSRATAIIWLDKSFPRTVTQSVGRSVRNIVSAKELWPGTGNRETFRRAFFSRQSILLWMLTTYHRVHRRYSALHKDRGDFNHVPFVRLKGRNAAEQFLSQVAEYEKFSS